MIIIENVREGIKAVQTNTLRSVLTAMIIAIGITSLVGILTAIEGIQSSINSSLSDLGANTFDVRQRRYDNRRSEGVEQKRYPPINYREARRFLDLYDSYGTPSLTTWVTGVAELSRGSKVTNPNMRIVGGDVNILMVEGGELSQGRNFSQIEAQNGANVVIIGDEVYSNLFEKNENPINQFITAYGIRFRVIGVLEKQGNIGGDSGLDRYFLVPLETARRVDPQRNLQYTITVAINDPTQMDYAMGQAIGLMRSIRKDPLGEPDSFEVARNQSLAESLEEITGYLRMGGFGIGFITLLGASIGLMNIMLVSVTERTREIGVRTALGASPTKIRQQFLIEAIVITQMGGIGGIILGILVGNLIAKLLEADGFVIPWFWMMIGLLIGMFVGILSGYLPAYKASKLDPIESLRFE
jgi:putative ABC transport system permease protein